MEVTNIHDVKAELIDLSLDTILACIKRLDYHQQLRVLDAVGDMAGSITVIAFNPSDMLEDLQGDEDPEDTGITEEDCRQAIKDVANSDWNHVRDSISNEIKTTARSIMEGRSERGMA